MYILLTLFNIFLLVVNFDHGFDVYHHVLLAVMFVIGVSVQCQVYLNGIKIERHGRKEVTMEDIHERFPGYEVPRKSHRYIKPKRKGCK